MIDKIKPKKQIWKKWWLWMGAFFVIIIIASAGGGEKKEVVPEQQSSQEQTQSAETSQPPQENQEVLTENNESTENNEETIEDQETIEKETPSSPEENSANKIIRVVDGDTFDVILADGNEDTIRLLGIDTPETHSANQPNEYGAITDTACLDEWGDKATEYAESLLANEEVSLVYDSTAGERGFYGRLLAYVEIDGQDFGTLLLENGYARVYTESNFQKETYYMNLQQEAVSNKIGLWSCSTESQSSEQASQTEHTFYLSTYHTATYYYCDTDDGWKGLSEKYLKSYPSEEALLADYPDRILHEPCK